MNCPHCADAIPDGSNFCNHCGMPSNEKPKQYGKHTVIFLLGMFVAGLAISGFYFLARTADKAPSAPTTVHAAPPPVPVTKTLVTGQLTVRPGSYVPYKVDIDITKMGDPVISGTFRASGGRGNDIQVVLADEDSLVNLLNGHSVAALYKSQPITIGKLNVPITESGTYVLVFNNRFSLLSEKQVFAEINLKYKEQQ